MTIFGREYGLKLTVGATQKLSKLCPEGDFAKFGTLLVNEDSTMKPFIQLVEVYSAIILAMSEGYENAKAFGDAEYEPKPITEAILQCLDIEEFKAFAMEAMSVFGQDKKQTVEVAPESGKKESAAARAAAE